MLTVVEVIPFTVVDKALALLVLLIEFTAGAVTAIPLTVEVIMFAKLLNVLVVVTGAAFDGAQFVPFQERTWPFEAPVVVPSGEPFIFVTMDAPRSPLTSPVTMAVRAEGTPFIVLINWLLPFCVRVLLLIILTGVEVIPFTDVDNEFVLLVLLIEFTTGADAATPFTVDVMVLVALLIKLVVTAGAAFAGAQFVPFQERTWPETGAVEEIALPCNWFAFQ